MGKGTSSKKPFSDINRGKLWIISVRLNVERWEGYKEVDGVELGMNLAILGFRVLKSTMWCNIHFFQQIWHRGGRCLWLDWFGGFVPKMIIWASESKEL